MRRLPVVVATAALALGGCGFGGNEEDEVVERLPVVDGGGAAVVDFEEARGELDLPDDADPADFPSGEGDEVDRQRRLNGLAALVLSYVGRPNPDVPIKDALDGSEIKVAASTHIRFGGEALEVVATDQDFDDIAGSLEDNGFERDGDILTTDQPAFQVGYRAVGGADDLVYLASDRKTVEDAIDRDDPEDDSEDVRDLLDELDGPARSVAIAPESDECVEILGMSDKAETDHGGELIVQARDDAEESGFAADDASGRFGLASLEFDGPSVDGDRLEVDYEQPDAAPIVSSAAILQADIQTNQIYNCG